MCIRDSNIAEKYFKLGNNLNQRDAIAVRKLISCLLYTSNGTLSPTIAGLLFFGEAYHITEVFPNYFLDYREECDDKAVRWLFRTHSNEGDWSGNIYDFCLLYTSRYTRLQQEQK